MTLAITFDDVAAAAQRLAGHAHRTPVLTSRTADELTGARVFFKAENFQRMGAFGGGAADAIGAIDAKGVGLAIPAPDLRAKTCGTHGQRLQQRGKGRRLRHGRRHGLEPALKAPVQGVVLHGLPVGPVRHLGHLPVFHHKAAVTAAPVAAAIAQVRVGRQIVPERLQGLQIGRRGARPAAESGRVQHGKAGRGQLRLQVRQRSQRRRGRHAAA